MLILLLAVWVICGVLEYGLCFGFFQREYPILAEEDRGDDKRRAFIAAMSGPIGLLSSLLLGHYKHGFKYS